VKTNDKIIHNSVFMIELIVTFNNLIVGYLLYYCYHY